MGEWVIGAFINIFGSVAINFGTNLLKLGHNEVCILPQALLFGLHLISAKAYIFVDLVYDQRERLALQDNGGGKTLKPIIHFQTWRVGIALFLNLFPL